MWQIDRNELCICIYLTLPLQYAMIGILKRAVYMGANSTNNLSRKQKESLLFGNTYYIQYNSQKGLYCISQPKSMADDKATDCFYYHKYEATLTDVTNIGADDRNDITIRLFV